MGLRVRGFPQEDWEQLVRRSRIIHLADGEAAFEQGSSPTAVYLLKSGRWTFLVARVTVSRVSFARRHGPGCLALQCRASLYSVYAGSLCTPDPPQITRFDIIEGRGVYRTVLVPMGGFSLWFCSTWLFCGAWYAPALVLFSSVSGFRLQRQCLMGTYSGTTSVLDLFWHPDGV